MSFCLIYHLQYSYWCLLTRQLSLADLTCLSQLYKDVGSIFYIADGFVLLKEQIPFVFLLFFFNILDTLDSSEDVKGRMK